MDSVTLPLRIPYILRAGIRTFRECALRGADGREFGFSGCPFFTQIFTQLQYVGRRVVCDAVPTGSMAYFLFVHAYAAGLVELWPEYRS